jgi:hypothetical protein
MPAEYVYVPRSPPVRCRRSIGPVNDMSFRHSTTAGTHMLNTKCNRKYLG